MSKKDNLKFKKRIKAQILENLSKDAQKPKEIPKVVQPNFVTPPATKESQVRTEPTLTNSENNSQDLIKSDLKKSAIIIGTIIALIIVIYIIDLKTGFLLKESSHLFNLFKS